MRVWKTKQWVKRKSGMMEWACEGRFKHNRTKFEVQSKHSLHLFTIHHDNLSPAIPNI